MPPRALILDFDGLIVDTEMVEFIAWGELYESEGAHLKLEDWLNAVGYVNGFDPRAHLERLTGRSPDWLALEPRRLARAHALAAALPPLPGVATLIEQGAQLGCLLGVASNSTLPWVEGGLRRLGFWDRLAAVRTRESVKHPKPDPEVYQRVLADLGLDASDAYAFEDSEPGVRAAKAAGLHVVAVPNQLTRHQDLSMADDIRDSLEGYAL